MTTFRFKLTTQIGLETLESNATTFGELKRDIQNSDLASKISFERSTENRDGQEWVRTIKLIERNTQAEFGAIDEARLPAGDSLIFFVTPMEHKGGLVDVQELHLESFGVVESELEELGYNEIRSFGSKLNKQYGARIDLSGKRDSILFNILNWLENYYNELDEKSTESVEENTTDPMENAKHLIYAGVNLVLEALEILEQFEATENLVGGVSLSELHEKALELQKQLNK